MDERSRHDNYPQLVQPARYNKLLARPEPDPIQIGWVKAFELRALYGLQSWKRYLERLLAREPHVYILTTTNAAWVYSVGAEAASHAGTAEQVLELGVRAVEMRAEGRDADGVRMAVQTIEVLLGDLGRQDLIKRLPAELDALRAKWPQKSDEAKALQRGRDAAAH